MRILSLFVIVLMLACRTGIAQEQAPPLVQETKKKSKSLLTVDSRPSGAIVELKGTYNFTGRTPFTVPYPINGSYEIRASKPGYESVGTELDLVGSQDSEIMIRLKARTRFKAAMRSIILPGWGQFYRGDKVRGAIFTAAQLGLGIGSLLAMNEYNQSQNALDRAIDNFNRLKSEEAFREVQARTVEAENDYDFRNTMLIITGAFWAYNVLDAIIFFSPKHTHFEIESNMLGQNSNSNSVVLSWKVGL